MKRSAGRILFAALAACVILLASGCAGAGSPNMPYEPDTPLPENHDGQFISDHGTMTFNGDGSSVVTDFDNELAEMLGIQPGEGEGTYEFLSGDLPPAGSVEVRYDAAHELKLTLGGETAEVTLGLASEDGRTASVGTGMVTPERIPMLFEKDGVNINVIFVKE